MRFKLKGTNAVLTPSNKAVEAMYLTRPDKYIPVIEEPVVEEKPVGKQKQGKGKADDAGS